MSPPAHTDPFDTLGISPRFALDPDEVQRAYLKRAARVHPDLVGDDPARSADAARLSASLNDAKATLLDPESRARALLRRLGGAPGAERDLPDGFLMEIMETRMEVEQASTGGNQAEMDRWRAWGRDQRDRAIAEVGAMFADLSTPAPAAGLARIQQRLNAWRYVERMLEQIEA